MSIFQTEIMWFSSLFHVFSSVFFELCVLFIVFPSCICLSPRRTNDDFTRCGKRSKEEERRKTLKKFHF